MFLKQKIQKTLKAHNISPNKILGQTFLINEKAAEDLVKAANVNKNDFVVEIGPGPGNLTCKISKKAKEVLAIEKDEKMAEIAKKETSQNVEVLCKDFLDFNLKDINKESYKVTGNLPFSAATPIVKKIIKDKRAFPMTFILQKEVAERVVAKPPKMNFLAVIINYFSRAKLIRKIERNNFWPAPEVDGAIIKLQSLKKTPKVPYKNFFEIVEAGFKHPRKQIKNNLTSFSSTKKEVENKLKEIEVNPKKRPQNLPFEDWVKITSQLNNKN